MIVVCDTSPLHYLILIEQDTLLPTLFGRVVAPPSVVAEMNAPEAPEKVREWLTNRPAWLEIVAPNHITSALTRLGAGEAEAISVAQQLSADVLLIDERLGAKLARKEGLFVTGTLGVLQTAANRKLISLVDALEKLGKTSFRHTPALFDELLKRQNDPSS